MQEGGHRQSGPIRLCDRPEESYAAAESYLLFTVWPQDRSAVSSVSRSRAALQQPILQSSSGGFYFFVHLWVNVASRLKGYCRGLDSVAFVNHWTGDLGVFDLRCLSGRHRTAATGCPAVQSGNLHRCPWLR